MQMNGRHVFMEVAHGCTGFSSRCTTLRLFQMSTLPTDCMGGWMDGWWNFALMKTLEVTQQIKEDNQKKPRASLAAPWPGWRTLLALANSII